MNETIAVERAVVIHSRATTVSKWVYQCLPKINYLVDSKWFGEGSNLKLILPATNYLGLYVELLKIESNVVWIYPNQLLNVESLLILDYNMPDVSATLLDPIPAASLVENIRFVCSANFLLSLLPFCFFDQIFFSLFFELIPVQIILFKTVCVLKLICEIIF